MNKSTDKIIAQESEHNCCENFNGTLDITNSCIFCKTYIPKYNMESEDLRLSYEKGLEDGLAIAKRNKKYERTNI